MSLHVPIYNSKDIHGIVLDILMGFNPEIAAIPTEREIADVLEQLLWKY